MRVMFLMAGAFIIALLLSAHHSRADYYYSYDFDADFLDELCVVLENELPAVHPCNYSIQDRQLELVLQSPLSTAAQELYVDQACMLANSFIRNVLGTLETDWELLIYESKTGALIEACPLRWVWDAADPD